MLQILFGDEYENKAHPLYIIQKYKIIIISANQSDLIFVKDAPESYWCGVILKKTSCEIMTPSWSA